MIKNNDIIDKENMNTVAVGTVLVEYFPGSKAKEKNYAIMTKDGVKYFQYSWYLKRFAYDPAENGIGISWTMLDITKFKVVEIIKLK